MKYNSILTDLSWLRKLVDKGRNNGYITRCSSDVKEGTPRSLADNSNVSGDDMARNEPGAKQGYEQACEDIADEISILTVNDTLERAGIELSANQLGEIVMRLREVVYRRRNKNPFKKKKEQV